MEPLNGPLHGFRGIVEADLRRAARLLVQVQDEIDPQLRVATKEGDYWIAATLPPDDYGRQAMLRRLATFMAWKQALAFTFAAELNEPDAVYCVGVSLREQFACLVPIRRVPKPWSEASFGAIEWLPNATIDPAIAGLLPRTPRAMTPKEVSAMAKWFGKDGPFPAVHIPTGEVRGV